MELDLEGLVKTFKTLDTNSRGETQQRAEDQLKAWESVPGYHYLLQSVYLDQALPLQVRWLAIICFKNGIDKYWRSTRIHAVSKEEKHEIRKRLFNIIDESNKQFTIQNAHAAARIARFDFPNEWPDLFENVSELLQQCASESNVVKVHNVLIIFNQIIKALAAVRIGRTRAAMLQKVPSITPILIKLYVSFFESWTKNFDLDAMEVGYVCLKVTRRIVTDGYDYPHRDPALSEFFGLSLNNLQTLIIEYEKQELELLERYIKCYTKMYLGLISDNPTAFVCLPSAMDTLMTYLSLLESKASVIYNCVEDDDFWEQIAVRSFTMIKRLVHFVHKKGAVTLKQRSDKEEVQGAVAKLSTDFFTPGLVQNLAHLIMTWYLKLRPKDLESWSTQPEEWVIEEMQMNWEFQIRPCAENIFQDLVLYFKEYLAEYVLSEISGGLSNNQSLTDILQKDAVFSIFQLSSQVVSERVDFDNLLNDLFIPEGLKNDMLESKILKRRICLIISEWLQIRCSKESRIEVYKLLLNFLQLSNPMNDKVVRLTAISTLMHAVDGWDFEKTAFKPYLEEFMTLLIGELSNMELTESKLFVLKVISIVIEITNPLLPDEVLIRVMSVIPALWENSSSQNDQIIKTSIIRVLKAVVTSLNSESPKSYEVAMPLIPICCDERSELHSLLSEDGYELLQSVLQYCPLESLPEQLATDFSLVLIGLRDSTEILPLVLSIIRSYALFGVQAFSTEVGLETFKILGDYLPSLRDDSLVVLSSMLEIIMLQLGRLDTLAEAAPVVSNMIQSGLFAAMLTYVLDETQSPPCVVRILVPLTRFMYIHPQGWFEVLTRFASNQNVSPVQVLHSTMELIVKRLKNVGEPKIRKLAILGLLAVYSDPALLTSIPGDGPSNDIEYNIAQLDIKDGVSYVLTEHLASMLFTVTQALEEINEDENGNCEIYSREGEYDNDELVMIGDATDEFAETGIKPSGERMRYTNLCKGPRGDPVYLVPLKAKTSSFIQGLKQRFGDSGFAALTSRIDRATIEQLEMVLG
ncbi:unnamed protein product [Kuraishia capsulata CBS 1993]|uniref:Importin N-terminal domain-containing protein n=1 Tax=Kuraishia capsulata CBS 1993 TaxID=1382522 RepID=W6MRS7_9ASCO|nr:uncharacterized protein KUCA_T00005464001 [Kuraishia capsulata CBS 1993]CDK29476.1 unnamed protein product [Kuraishia capsulata CBS 1993]